jgi:hypothetical protein
MMRRLGLPGAWSGKLTLKRWPRTALLLILAGVIVWLGWSTVRTGRAMQLTLADLNRIEATARTPNPEALAALRGDFAALETHLTTVQAASRPFLWAARGLGWLPRIGPSVRAAPTLLAMSLDLAGAGRLTLDALGPNLAGLNPQTATGQTLTILMQALADAHPALIEADARLARVTAMRATVGGPLIAPIARQIERLDRTMPLAQTAVQVALAAPRLLGADAPRTYLILAQNSDELRATGGFISAAGHVRLNKGRIESLKLMDSYAVDNLQRPHPAPPRPLSEQMGAQMLVLRDSNWSPDFPTSSDVARALYAQDQGVATDGAIGLDLEAVRLLVGALGPLDVPGMNGSVTAENVIQQMRKAWETPLTANDTVQEATSTDWWVKRKDFMGEMFGAALAEIEAGDDPNVKALGLALVSMLSTRDLQIAVDDPELAAVLAERGWDGGLRVPEESDFLAVIDSNVGFNKANASVQQAIAYRVEPAQDHLEASLTLTYTHTAQPLPPDQPCDRTPRYGESYDALTERCYWDYLRVYVPSGSELLAVEGIDAMAADGGERHTTVFHGPFSMRPGEQRVITMRYRLPETVPTRPYRLAVRKQAGTPAWTVRIEAGACRWEMPLRGDLSVACAEGVR